MRYAPPLPTTGLYSIITEKAKIGGRNTMKLSDFKVLVTTSLIECNVSGKTLYFAKRPLIC
jgi:hypothetical protein